MEFQRSVADLEAEVPGLTREAFYVRLASLVALGKDAHTSLGILASPADTVGLRTLPLLLRWFDDGILVTAATTTYSDLNGARVLQVRGTPVEVWTDRLRSIIPHENESWFRSQAPAYIRNLGVLRALGAAPANGPAVFVAFGFGRQHSSDPETFSRHCAYPSSACT